MSLLVVGSVAIDTVETPKSKAEGVLGGSATYFSYAASFFYPVSLVGVVGDDFPTHFTDVFRKRPIDISGLFTLPGKTFRWHGRYTGRMNEAETVKVELGVFGNDHPGVPEKFRSSRFVFLANASPHLQSRILDEMQAPQLVVADTMNYWIENEREALIELFKRIKGIAINEREIRMLTLEHNLAKAAKSLLALGPDFVVVKRGDKGSVLFTSEEEFSLSAFPPEELKDPTGAGDAFAGGMMGYLARTGDHSLAGLKKAVAYGTVVASIGVEDFSLGALERTERKAIEARFVQLMHMTGQSL
ncbi:MAG: sugar kinase [Planctomycetes bacterium DG_23]|nr:MAG: sugar kinase [Planctomycetes bacterium DG_23]